VRFSFDGLSPFIVFEPAATATSPALLLPALIAGLLALALTSLAWPVSALVRRHYGAPYRLTGQDAKAHRWVRIASTAVVALMIAWVATIATLMGDLNKLEPGADPWIWVLQLLSFLVFIGGAALAVWNALVVVRGPRKWYAKAWAVILALAALVLLWIAFAYNLIAFDVNY
jgi:hypothetical protein